MCFGTSPQEPALFTSKAFPCPPGRLRGAAPCPAVTGSRLPSASCPRRPGLSEAGLVPLPRPARTGGERLGRPAALPEAPERPRGKSGPQAAVLPQAALARQQRPEPGDEARGRNGAAGVPVHPARLAWTPRGRGGVRGRTTPPGVPHGAVAARGMPGLRRRRGLHDLPLPPARRGAARPVVSRWAGLRAISGLSDFHITLSAPALARL